MHVKAAGIVSSLITFNN